MVGQDGDVAFLQCHGCIVGRQLHRTGYMSLGQLHFARPPCKRGRKQPAERILRRLDKSDVQRVARRAQIAQSHQSASPVEMNLTLFQPIGQTPRQCRVKAGPRLGGVSSGKRGITCLGPQPRALRHFATAFGFVRGLFKGDHGRRPPFCPRIGKAHAVPRIEAASLQPPFLRSGNALFRGLDRLIEACLKRSGEFFGHGDAAVS